VGNISAAPIAYLAVNTAVKVYHHTAAVYIWQLVFKLWHPFAIGSAVKIPYNLAAQLYRYGHIAWSTAAVAAFCAHNYLTFDNYLYPWAVCVAVHQFFTGVGNTQRCKLSVDASCAVHKACAAVDKAAHAGQNNFFVNAAAGNAPHIFCTDIQIFAGKAWLGNAKF